MKYPQVVSMPTAISDWLEEQLEARGIDAVLYTRYVLSLLHSHPVDVIWSDEDLHYSHLRRNVRKSGGGRKRVRRSSSDWWRYAQVDAEQIKRSAAVQCLMSASDQNCEMESLVDELCEKLKEADGGSQDVCPASVKPPLTTGRRITPRELAERYYAAFPPLKPRSPQSRLAGLWKRAGAKKEQQQQQQHDSVKIHTMQPKQQRLSFISRNARTKLEHQQQQKRRDRSVNKKPKQQSLEEIKGSSENHRCLEVDAKDAWMNDDDVNMYDYLPVDIKELLDSPEPHYNSVEMMNVANMRDDGKRSFIAYGTNIMSSIWSTDRSATYENNFNLALDTVDPEAALDFKFSTISIDNTAGGKVDDWIPYISDNETNNFFENENNGFFDNNWNEKCYETGSHSLPGDWAKGDVKEEDFQNEKLLHQVALSLIKLNHNKEKSCFAEIVPRGPYNSKNCAFNLFNRTTSIFGFNSKQSFGGYDSDKEDLLTSERSHFKPIGEKIENRTQGQYADGATFLISNNLDKVDYKRSESGSMVLENEYGQSKKYWEYKLDSTPSPEFEFVLKFSICQNDKACQTENICEADSGNEKPIDQVVNAISRTPSPVYQESQCTCLLDVVDCPKHPMARPDSTLGEVMWKYEAKQCIGCNNNNKNNASWSWTKEGKQEEWGSRGLRDIWGRAEICHTCRGNGTLTTAVSPSFETTLRLREDISQDGEQLLSDLHHWQKAYMEGEEPVIGKVDQQQKNLVEIFADGERKRRRSFMIDLGDEMGNEGTWSFASRLEEDCLIQMSTLPTLRSVTL